MSKINFQSREIKFKKLIFSELPSDFVLFKQNNISAKQMYQTLLALHSVDACNQEVISVEDIYEITDSLDSLSVGKPQKKSKVAQQPEEEADLEWPRQEDEFLITLDET